MTLILHAFSAYKTGRLSSFSSQARKTMLPPFSNNSTGYLLSKEFSLKFYSTFSSVLLTQLQLIWHLLWNSINQCVGDCDQLLIQPDWWYPRYTPGHLNLLLIKRSASMHLGFGIVCQFQCALPSPYLRLKKGWKLTSLVKCNFLCCFFIIFVAIFLLFVYSLVIVALRTVIILKWRSICLLYVCMYVCMYVCKNLLHQTWLIARYSKILWGAISCAQVSEIWKPPPTWRRF